MTYSRDTQTRSWMLLSMFCMWAALGCNTAYDVESTVLADTTAVQDTAADVPVDTPTPDATQDVKLDTTARDTAPDATADMSEVDVAVDATLDDASDSLGADSTDSDTTSTDVVPDGSDATQGCAAGCTTAQLCCAGVCVANDMLNCGSCGTACGTGEFCDVVNGCSTCDAGGLADCSGTCADLAVDDLHCGACGVACPNSVRCTASRCDCGDGLHCTLELGDRCRANKCECGSTGAACDPATTSTCAGGVCLCGSSAPCTGGQTCDDATGSCI